MMTTRIAAGLGMLATALVTASVVGTRRPASSPPPRPVPSAATGEDPIDPLDRCVQKRLHEHTGFGMSRLADELIQLHRFVAESPEEESALAELRGSGMAVGLYLGARDLLAAGPSATGGERPIGRPIVVTGGISPEDLPRPHDLRQVGRAALAAAEGDGSAAGSVGRWSVAARVVRADRQSCLECHTPDRALAFPTRGKDGGGRLEIGDAIGVAIYVYARSPGGGPTRRSTPARSRGAGSGGPPTPRGGSAR
jgi:hypothetical protein